MLNVNSCSPALLLWVRITTRRLLHTEREWDQYRKPVTTPWSQPGTQSCCPKHTQGNRGIPAKSLQADLSKVAGQGLLCKLQHASALVEGAAHAFQNLLALILNLSYKRKGWLQYYRICSKILTVLSSFLKTSQQPVIQVANAPTRLRTKDWNYNSIHDIN